MHGGGVSEASESSEPTRWSQEREYFDSQAHGVEWFDIDTIANRYEAAMRQPRYPLEVAYAMLGSLKGKRVLDIGCGNGENSLLFARWGATVTGVDISTGAISVATRRSEELGLNTRVQFIAAPFEAIVEELGPFDVVWSAAFIHHVLDVLPEVAQRLSHLCAPEGFVLFMEPVRLSPLLKKLRTLVPAFPEGTPDERPLEPADLDVLKRSFAFEALVTWGPLARLSARTVVRRGYEKAGALRRSASTMLFILDRLLQGHTGARWSSMQMVVRLVPRSAAQIDL
jgi:2-polyprenyl-3-methyl-5-hydroxy-6-metoxy-1,4-benzoquinol methylase